MLSGNRNFEGRVHPQVKANYLASPVLVVAYALAGHVDLNIQDDPIGIDPEGRDVYLRDIWPSQSEIAETIAGALEPDMFREQYSGAFDGPKRVAGSTRAVGSSVQLGPRFDLHSTAGVP